MMKIVNYEVVLNDPVVEKTLSNGKKVRLPFAIEVDGKWLSDHATPGSACRQIAAHKRKRAEEYLEELQLERMLAAEF